MKTTPQERDTIRRQLGAQFVYGRQVQVEVDHRWLYDLLQDYLELELKIQSMEAEISLLAMTKREMARQMDRR